MSTIGPFRMTRRAQCVLKARSASPMRVPPPQSWTSRARRVSARLPRRAIRCGVIRVNRVANRNTSTRVALCGKTVDEMQQHAAVSLHGSADVAEQHDRPRPSRRVRRGRSMRSPSITFRRRTGRRSRSASGAALPAARAAAAQAPRKALQQRPGAFELAIGELAEVLRPRDARRAPRADRTRRCR